MRFLLSNYIAEALAGAEYDKLEDGTFAGKIALCLGVISFGQTLRECEDELRSTLEDWIYLGLRKGDQLPVLNGINLNRKIRCESVESM